MKYRYIYFAALISIILFVSCGIFRTTIPLQLYEPLPDEPIVGEDIRFDIDTSNVNSIKIIYKNSQDPLLITDYSKLYELERLIRNSTYDDFWNEGGIMVKTVEPDYTIIIDYVENYDLDNLFIMFWKDTGKIKYKGIWYVLEESGRTQVYEFLNNMP
ncbi:MAG: hypothetical protein LUF90_10135 [Rikenellaceae bacterium]|nr:hypothetical protein [Rikenellaceae bacterium]